MSNLVHEEEMAIESSGPEVEKQSISLGDVGDIRPVPRITLQAFCETEQVAEVLNAAAKDRRMIKAHVKVNMGGISAAAEFYEIAPTPNLIVVESMLSGDELMNDLARLANNCDGETKVVVIGHKNDISLYRQLVSSGVSEYLVAPLSMADVMNTVAEIFVNPDKGALGKIVAFIGAKGGVGSSTICHNVAWSISNNFKSDVMLADLDLAFGTANINLDQDPTMGIADAVFSPDRVDDILLDRLLAKCAEHLSLLAAPSTLERTYDFDPNAFTNVLDVAQRSTPVVAVDLPHQWNGWTKQVLSTADEVVIVACPELANLRNTKNLLDTIMDLRPNDEPPRLVMNQVGVPKRPEIAIPDFVGPLGIEPSAIIPFDPALFGTASNNGQMISEADAKHPTSEIFNVLGQILTGKAELKIEKKSALGFFSRLKRNRG